MNTGDFLIQERNMSTLGNLLYGKHYFRSLMQMVVSDCYHKFGTILQGEWDFFSQDHIVSGRTGVGTPSLNKILDFI